MRYDLFHITTTCNRPLHFVWLCYLIHRELSLEFHCEKSGQKYPTATISFWGVIGARFTHNVDIGAKEKCQSPCLGINHGDSLAWQMCSLLQQTQHCAIRVIKSVWIGRTLLLQIVVMSNCSTAFVTVIVTGNYSTMVFSMIF